MSMPEDQCGVVLAEMAAAVGDDAAIDRDDLGDVRDGVVRPPEARATG